MLALQYLTIISVVVAVVAMIIKALRYATAPQSLRWELYPVPHEKGRADYGGSYLEELDWWTKPRHSDFLREIREMAAEIILLKGVFHHNRKVWLWSFLFHDGLYLCVGWLALLLLGAILQQFGVVVGGGAGGFGGVVHVLTLICGYAGLVLTPLGAIGLFIWRSTDTGQRRFSAPIDYFNLLFFVAATVVALWAHLSADPSHTVLREYVQSTVTLSGASLPGGVISAEIVLVSLLILWIPLTRMSHFVAKYFLYHAVRWEDTPNERGSKLEAALLANLGRRTGWSGPHLRPDKTWGETATETIEHE